MEEIIVEGASSLCRTINPLAVASEYGRLEEKRGPGIRGIRMQKIPADIMRVCIKPQIGSIAHGAGIGQAIKPLVAFWLLAMNTAPTGSLAPALSYCLSLIQHAEPDSVEAAHRRMNFWRSA